MIVRIITILVSLTLFGLANYSHAGFWDAGGPDNLWSTALNWEGNALPINTDAVVTYHLSNGGTRYPVIQSGVAAEAGTILLGDLGDPGWGGGAVALNMTGGSLVVQRTGAPFGDFKLGRVDFNRHLVLLDPFVSVGANEALFNISDGIVSVEGAIFLGEGSSGTVNQTGGFISTRLLLMNFHSAGVGDASSQYNLDGGSLNLTNNVDFGIDFWDNGLINFDLGGGLLTSVGNQVLEFENLETNGILTAYNGMGTIQISYSPVGDLTSVTASAPITGDADFDHDGDVDGADFLTWQRGFGLDVQPDNSSGDANGDGFVNASDLAIWATQFGGSPLSAVGEAVPEPASLVLGMLALGSLSVTSYRARLGCAGM